MNTYISLCNEKIENENLILELPYNNFIDLWKKYLNLPFNENVFESEFKTKTVIDAIDSKLDTSYESKESGLEYLDNLKILENICMAGLAYQDNICVRVQ